MKLASEREFKTVFLGITKKTQSGRLQLVCGHCIFCGYCPLGLGSSALESCVPCHWRFFSVHWLLMAFVRASESWHKTRRSKGDWDYMGVTWPWLCSWWHSSETVHWRMSQFPPLCGILHYPAFPRKYFNYFAYIWPNFVILHIEVCRMVNQNS